MLKIKELCRQLDIVPTKRKGQNFLVNEKILDKIVAAADLEPNDIILEIGPGLGHLTEKVAEKAKKVIAVELDKRLATYLKEKFANQKNIQIIQADILKLEPEILNLKSQEYKLVANLPYNIAGAVLRKFLSEAPKPKLMVLMLQKEVAERILAKNQKYTIISLAVAFYGQPEIVGFVLKNHFWPKPKVDSAIIKISRIDTNLPQINTNLFFKIMKTGFSSPRKQLLNNLKKIKEKQVLETIFKKINLDPKIRAEDITLEKWFQIYHYIHDIYEER